MASNSTICISFKTDDSKFNIKAISENVEDFQKVLGATIEEAEKLKTSLINFNQASEAFDQMADTITNLRDVFGGLADEYNIAEQNEQRLAQAMRNTMDATDDEVQRIKDLCDAQEAKGVVDAQAQLAGAQELATYLELSRSLETLLPVLADMTAQQYGVGASAESVTSIATMLGKVMNGQVNALSRYGYKFDEAQEQILKFGTEEQRAAVLAEVVEQSVRGMNEELGKTGAAKMFQLESQIGRVKEAIGAATTKIMPFINGIASMTLAITGMLKLGSSIKAFGAAWGTLATGVKKAIKAFKELSLVSKGLVVGAVGAVIAVITTLVSKHREQAAAAREASEAYKEKYKCVEDARAELTALSIATGTFNGTAEEEAALVDDINSKWGQTFGNFQTAAAWYKKLSESIDTYCLKLQNEVELEDLRNTVASYKGEREDLDKRIANVEAYRDTAYSAEGGAIVGSSASGRLEELKAESAALDDAYNKAKERMAELYKANAELSSALTSTSQGAGAGGDISGTSDSINKLSDAITRYYAQVERTVEVHRTFSDGTAEIDVRLEAMRSGITSLINQYGAQDAKIQQLISSYWALAATADKVQPKLEKLPGINGKAETTQSGLIPQAPTVPTVDTDNLSTAREAVDALGQSMRNLSGCVNDGASSWLSWISNLLGAVASAIPAIAALTAARNAEATANTAASATGAAASQASIPVVGPIMAVAAVASVIAALTNLPKFAQGGIAYAPTVGMFGEYSGARTNPEVVAPLDRLKTLIEPQGMGGTVEFVISGRNLKGILNRESKINGRS